MEQQSDNRRDFLRMEVAARLQFSVADDPTVFEGVSRNLSAGGLLFETERALSVGQELRVRVLPEHQHIPPLTATLRVTRVEPEGAGFLVAGELLDVS